MPPGVEHELKTPLTSIRSLCEIMLDYPDRDEAERIRFLRRLLEESERLACAVERLLGSPGLQHVLRKPGGIAAQAGRQRQRRACHRGEDIPALR